MTVRVIRRGALTPVIRSGLRSGLPGNAGKEALEAYSAAMMSHPLDPSKPLWQFSLIDNYQGGSALLSRIHHCIADGIALVGVMLKLADQTPVAHQEIVAIGGAVAQQMQM